MTSSDPNTWIGALGSTRTVNASCRTGEESLGTCDRSRARGFLPTRHGADRAILQKPIAKSRVGTGEEVRTVGRALILWLLGVPATLIVVLYLLHVI